MGPTTARLGTAATGCTQGLLIVPEIEEPTRCLLKVSGELDLATADLLTCAIDQAAGDYREVGVDLSALTFCDVVGATALERALHQVRAHRSRVSLYGIDGPLHLLLAAGGLFSALKPSSCPQRDLSAKADTATQ
jgi:anti-anti-sigma factor